VYSRLEYNPHLSAGVLEGSSGIREVSHKGLVLQVSHMLSLCTWHRLPCVTC